MPALQRLANACALGNGRACSVLLKIKLHAFTGRIFGKAADDHPNKMPFSGTLVLLDVPSNKPPHGAQGHRIMMPQGVAERRLKDLIGMGLNYAPSLDAHAPRKKVGVIEKAWIEGNAVKVKGFVYKKDFPEAVKDLKTSGLGMSMELADVYVASKDDDVWRLEDFRFTGATVLYKKAAAYYQTALAAQRGRDGVETEGGKGKMKKTDKAKQKAAAGNKKGSEVLATVIASAVQRGVSAAVQPLVAQNKKLGKRLARIAASQEQLSAKIDDSLLAMDEDDELDTVAAAADDDEDVDADDDDDDVAASADDDDDEDDDDADISAAKKGGDDDDDDDDDGYNDDDEVDATNDDPDMDDLNDDDVSDKTKKTKPTGQAGKPNPKAGLKAGGYRMTAAALKVNRKLRKGLKAANDKSTKLEKKLARQSTQLEALQAQVDRYSETVDRRTLSSEVRTLLSKAGHNIGDLVASGDKLTTEQVDKAFRDSGLNLDIVSRIALKNQLVQNNLMEQGEIKRFN